MLNADSSAEKRDTELQISATAPDDRERRARSAASRRRRDDRSTDWFGKDVLEVRDESARRVGLVEEAEHESARKISGRTTPARSTRPSPRGACRARRRSGRRSRRSPAPGDGAPGVVAQASFASFGRRRGDRAAALSELVELSTQVVEVVIAGPDGAVGRPGRAGTSAHARSRRQGRRSSPGRGPCDGRGGRAGARRARAREPWWSCARAGESIRRRRCRSPPAGLVVFDLRTALRRVGGRAGREARPPRCRGRGRVPRSSAAAHGPRRVVVGWSDGSELELRPGTPERERLVEDPAGGVLR